MAVKVRWSEAPEELRPPKAVAGWAEILEANARNGPKVYEAVMFVHRHERNAGLPAVVSFSGGKDSLASLLLRLRTGLNFRYSSSTPDWSSRRPSSTSMT